MNGMNDKHGEIDTAGTAGKLRPITVRFSEDAYAAISDIAEGQGRSMADIVRMAVDDRLITYLDSVRYIDAEQGAEIKSVIKALFDEMAAVKMELHRIGVNYNQDVRLRQLERRTMSMMDRVTQRVKIMEESKDFRTEDVAALIKRYEDATAKAGEILCHILG